jgi:hypothetical protein
MKYMVKNEWTMLEANFTGKLLTKYNPNLYILLNHNLLKGDNSCQKILEYYDEINTFITKFLVSIKAQQSVICTAMVFFHKYFLYLKCFQDESDKYLTCFACVFLASKACNVLLPLPDLINVYWNLIPANLKTGKLDSRQIFELTESLTLKEFEVLDNLGFDLNVDLPFTYINQMKQYYLEYLKNSKLIIITTNIINDSFILPLCLYYDPLLIALASMYLLSVYFRIDFPDTREGRKWYHLIDSRIALEDIKELSVKIYNIYEFSTSKDGNKSRERFKDNGIPVICFDPCLRRTIVENNLDEEEGCKNVLHSLESSWV